MTDTLKVQAAKAIKAQLVKGVKAKMKAHKISQSELARRMSTSRMVVHRLLNPYDLSLSLRTLANLAVGLKIKVHITL